MVFAPRKQPRAVGHPSFPFPRIAARFLDEFSERVNLNTRAYFAWVYAIRWLGFRLDVVVAMVLVACSFFSVALNEFTHSIGEFCAQCSRSPKFSVSRRGCVDPRRQLVRSHGSVGEYTQL